jgi:ABC-2 type transport system permease protein
MLRYLLEKEFKQIVRNRFLPKFILLFPLVSLLIFPLVANFDLKHATLVVVDNDHSPWSQRLQRKAVASGYFRLTRVASTFREALASVEADDAEIILEIPPGFERSLVTEGQARVLIAANSVSGMRGGLGSAYLASIVTDFGAELRDEWRQGTLTEGAAGVPALEILPRYRFNPHLEYRFFMVPALMVMMLTLICAFLPALNIVGEKEKGTIEQMNVTPVGRLTFILSKLLPYWVIGFVVLHIGFLVAWLFYGLWPLGGVGTIYLFASLFVLALSGFGLVISNHARSLQQAMFMMFFFVMSLIFLSGMYTPVASMPDWAQTLSTFSPLKYMILVLRQVYLKGAHPEDLRPALLALACFALFFNTWAVLSYRKRS